MTAENKMTKALVSILAVVILAGVAVAVFGYGVAKLVNGIF